LTIGGFRIVFDTNIHQTKVNSLLSEPENLLSGVIQGSGIGFIMFVMFINDLIDALNSSASLSSYLTH